MALDGEWEATAVAALKDPRSDEYDSTILDELRNYNARFATTPGFEKLRMHLFKAVLLTESGGPSSIEWTCRPMQIGNPGDPGYDVLREHQENSNIIMSRALQRDIATKSIDHPILNIRAGIALVLTKAARFSCRSDADPSVTALTHTSSLRASRCSRSAKLNTRLSRNSRKAIQSSARLCTRVSAFTSVALIS
jgi:hypothetical protein